jgi:hypothetical protein
MGIKSSDIKLNNKDILFYIAIMTTLSFIWYSSKIKLQYIFPFVIFCIIFYYFEMKKIEIIEQKKIVNQELKAELFVKEYKYLKDNDILHFIDGLREIREYNIPVFNELLHVIDVFYRDRNIENLLIIVEIYESMYYSIPVDLTYVYMEKLIELKRLLKSHLIEKDRKMVEMQSFIPATYTSKNYIHDM